MATPQASPGLQLRVERTFTAPRATVFQAWTDPQKLSRWLGRATPQHQTEVLEFDLRVGGRYRMHITSPEGKLYHLGGTYREILPPEKLVFTWSCEEDPDSRDTLVTVEFHDLKQFTRVVLRHERFLGETSRDGHQQGWSACFDTLETLVGASS